ncbi:MAG: hypothetical protein AAGC43_04640 [Bacteroidota bacterium]
MDGQTPNWGGLFYTDGCGNDVAFKASYAINPKGIIEGNSSNLDWDMVNEMYIAGWDVFNHAYTPQVTFDWVYPISTGGSVSGRVITCDTDFSASQIAVGDTIFNSNSGGLAQNPIGVVESIDLPSRTITLVEDAILPAGYSVHFPSGFSDVWGMNDSVKDTAINSELDLAASAVRNELGIKMVNFTAPSNDELYDPITRARAQAGTLRVVNNIKEGARFIGTDFPIQTWFDLATRTAGIGAAYDFNSVSDPNMTRTASDQQFIVDHLATMGVNENAWFTIGVHRVNYREVDTGFATSLRYETFKNFFDRVEATWGKAGDDSLWFAPINELYEYWIAKEETQLTTTIDGNTVTVVCDFSDVDTDFREHALSLLVDTDVDITNISFENFDTTSFNIGHGGDNTTALVNSSYKPDYDDAVTRRGTGLLLTSRVEQTQSQGDLDEAQAFIDTLPNGSFKDGLQSRIDAVVVIPDATVVQIDFGQSFGGRLTPFPWNNFDESGVGVTAGSILNNLTDTLGSQTTISCEVIADFISHGSFNGVDGDSNALFPHTANRDGFEASSSNGVIRFSGLKPDKVYDFVLFGTRAFVGGTTTFNVSGATNETTTLLVQNNGQGNDYRYASFTGIAGNGSNQIDLEVVAQGFINVIQLTERNA